MLRGGTHEGSMVMRRFGLLVLVLAAAVGLSAQARAATTIVLDEGGADPGNALGPGIWELTIQADSTDVNFGGQFGIVGGVNFTDNVAVCDDNLLVICANVQGSDIDPTDPTLVGNMYMIIAVNTADLSVGGPHLLGTVTGNNLTFTLSGLEIVAGTPLPGFSAPVTFEARPIPEPAVFAFLGIGLASLAFLRRRAA